jgi:hypothetical protein
MQHRSIVRSQQSATKGRAAQFGDMEPLSRLVPTPKYVANQAADKNRGCKKPSPYGDTYKPDDQDSHDHDKSNGMAGPHSGTELAKRNNFPRAAILVCTSDHLA